jgi:3-oxoacyl-[acyl-carrier protein] reductase
VFISPEQGLQQTTVGVTPLAAKVAPLVCGGRELGEPTQLDSPCHAHFDSHRCLLASDLEHKLLDRGRSRHPRKRRSRCGLPASVLCQRLPTVFRLDGRVALVTGAASGIGAATARVFAEAGADVAACWYPADPHNVAPTVEEITGAGRRCHVAEIDVADNASVMRAVDSTVSELGRIDIVLANAAIARDVPFAELDDERFEALLQVDLLGVVRTFRAAVPHLIDRGWGRLLATSSIAGAHQGWARHAHYTTAKAALVGLVRTLAVELGPHGITANAIAPGVIETPQSLDPVNSLGPEGVRAFASRVPVGRNGTPEDIAHAFLYLASEEASFVTGQVILVDGGVSLSLD